MKEKIIKIKGDKNGKKNVEIKDNKKDDIIN
jgi:hypothetical protein